jgi:hypothetical protein
MDQSLSSLAGSLGKESIQLFVLTVFRLRDHLLAQM